MARRKQAPEGFHREQIALAAEQLFRQKGTRQTTMDEIAAASGYSKATLYVCFSSKEALVAELTLRSMRMLLERLQGAVAAHSGTRARYDAICAQLVEYYDAFPYYFETALGKIALPTANSAQATVETEIYRIGESNNAVILAVLEQGVRHGALRPGVAALPTVFALWGSISGLILLAANKQAYLEVGLGLGRDDFLAAGFDLIYHSIAKGEAE